MYDFMQTANKITGQKMKNYRELYEFSVGQPEVFWDLLWKYLGVISTPYDKVVSNINEFITTRWFLGAKMNYAENLLKFGDSDRIAIVFRGENSVRRVITYRELTSQVKRTACKLKELGVKKGDFVCGYMPNLPETIIAMLATGTVGAVWCSCATDIGQLAAIDRLGQVAPKVMFTADGYYYKGKAFNVLDNAKEIVKGIPSVQAVIVAHYAGDMAIDCIPNALSYDEVQKTDESGFSFEQVEATAPVVVMFSSGTTGKPKCMVQSVGGLLINQLKELVLHHDMKPNDIMLYITTCSWMMWNWQAAALGAGSTVVLYDGNPSYPQTDAIWRILEEEKVTVFGLSASYIHSLLKSEFSPKDLGLTLPCLRCISQTGSALSDEGFKYVYREIKSDLHFNSIAGGTDINGCFASGNPMSPVYSNELQAPGLGMKINCFNEDGKPVRDVQGELVCEQPTPSMPLYFWNDPDNERYKAAYFGMFGNVWNHGDYVVFDSFTGGITFYGRSDSVLKPSGIRIGTAEIYNQVRKIDCVLDSLAIGQQYNNDQRIILFVQMKYGKLTDDIIKEIKHVLKVNASPRHVPALIIEVPDIPKTLNGKKVESAVTNIVNGRKVTNRDALINPESLDFFYANLPSLQ